MQLCLAFSLLFSSSLVAATITYSYEQLNLGFGPKALNNRGWIAGQGISDLVTLHPYRYRPGIGTEKLSNLPGVAWDINDAGTAVGYLQRNSPVSCCLWKAIVRPAGDRWTDIGTLGGRQSVSFAINEAGQVVGRAETSDRIDHAFVYTAAEGMSLLGVPGEDFGRAFAINESGQILFISVAPGPPREHTFFFFDPVTGMSDVETLVGQHFNALALSDNGTIAGAVGGRAAVYSSSIGLRKLGTLGGTQSRLVSINDRGWAVGWSALEGDTQRRAVLYVRGHGLMDLNSLAPSIDVIFDRAIDINDHDQILASGLKDGVRRSYLLSRIREEPSVAEISNPEPSTWLLLVAGLLCITSLRKRAAHSLPCGNK